MAPVSQFYYLHPRQGGTPDYTNTTSDLEGMIGPQFHNRYDLAVRFERRGPRIEITTFPSPQFIAGTGLRSATGASRRVVLGEGNAQEFMTLDARARADYELFLKRSRFDVATQTGTHSSPNPATRR